jgi:hypothetical protein
VGPTLDPADPRVPIHAIEAGIELLDEAERRRIVDDWASAYPHRWESLCGAVGDSSLVARAFVASAVRGGISERRTVPRELVALFEGRELRDSPVAALGIVLPAPLVWARDAVTLLRRETGRRKQFSSAQLEDAIAVALDYVGDEQVERVSVRSGRLARELPIPELPTASETLSRGCKIVAF